MAVRNELLNEGRAVPLTKLCEWLQLPRATAYYQPRQRLARIVDQVTEFLAYELIQEFPAFGIRRVWAYLRFRLKVRVNLKKSRGSCGAMAGR